jgi:hypothetical protein
MNRLLLSLSLLLIAGSGLTAEYTAGDLVIKQIWARPTPPVAAVGAAYFTLDNSQGQDERLLSAEADVAATAELHAHSMEGNMMKMHKVDAVEVPAGQTVAFAPGGLHVMLIGLKAPLVEGNTFPLTLHFEHAGAVTVEVVIGLPPV